MKYVIGTRGSGLALAQAKTVYRRLAEAYPKDSFEIQVIKTKGDLVLDKPLHEIGDKGVFVKEIEEQLLAGKIHIGVHSMKDMPAEPACGLTFAKAWRREDPRDVLILRKEHSLSRLAPGAVIGTGSKRREFQLKKLRPDLRVTGIRGNVETRLRKMEEEKLDGIVLAAAGLIRLGMENRITQYLEIDQMIPAPAQGILALEISEKDKKLSEMLNAFSDEDTELAAEAERGFLKEIGGSCHVPVGAVFCKDRQGVLWLRAMYGDETGERQAYVNVSGSSQEELVKKAAADIRQKMAGTVTLVGAGPGDPELITVKGLKALKEADCIVYDRLVSTDLLKEAKNGCEMIFAGKASHNHTMPQEEINRLLVQKSMEYQHVVRLKGGDVYVFGRGGEEGLYLRQCGIPFAVVPGISSAAAAPAYAGIPVTHRGMSGGFHVVTAHNQNDELADIDFQALANSKETCIFLMGLGKVREITEKLLQAGMERETIAAVISHATTPEQKTCVSDLAHIADETEAAGLTSPAVIVVGDTVALRERLNFFEERPLFGKRYLIPKIGEAPTELRLLLQRQGAAVDEILAGKITEKKQKFHREQFLDVDWLIFTSRHGVDSFFQSFKESCLDVRCLSGCQIAAVGEKTADALKTYGIYADFIPEENNSDALYAGLKERVCKEDAVWYCKAAGVTNRLCEGLNEICRFREIEVYENTAIEPDLKSIKPLETYDGILFTCASLAERLLGAAGTAWQDAVTVYSIGPKTTKRLKEWGIRRVLEAKTSSYEGLALLFTDQERAFTARSVRTKI